MKQLTIFKEENMVNELVDKLELNRVNENVYECYDSLNNKRLINYDKDYEEISVYDAKTWKFINLINLKTVESIYDLFFKITK